MSCSDNFAAIAGIVWLKSLRRSPDRQSRRQDFATDGRRFYFAIEDRQSDVFVAEMVRK